jgi:hypothetical protein
MSDDRISKGWDLIFRGLPYFNVVKLTDGYQSIFSVIYESGQNKDIDKLNNIRSQIDENVKKIRERTKELENKKETKGKYETELLSCNIVFEELKALSRVTSAMVEIIKSTSSE